MSTMVEVTHIIGADDGNNPVAYEMFLYEVIEAACMYAGGCTFQGGRGFWNNRGHLDLDLYLDENEEEPAVIIKTVVSTANGVGYMRKMEEAIASYAKYHGVPIEWVHCQTSMVNTAHFNVNEVLERMNRQQYRDIVSPGTRWAHQ